MAGPPSALLSCLSGRDVNMTIRRQYKREAGFTLVEVLVGLLVLSFAASTLAMTLSGAFQSYGKVNHLAADISEQERLTAALDGLAEAEYLLFDERRRDRSDETLEALQFESGAQLVIEETDVGAELQLVDERNEAQTLFSSDHELALYVKAHPLPPGQRLSNLTYHRKRALQLIEVIDGQDYERAFVPLRVSIARDCQYDIVGRRCR